MGAVGNPTGSEVDGGDGLSKTKALRPYHPASWVRGAIRAYQRYVSPSLGPSCRYLPTCSDYATEAIEVHGLWKGGWMATRRIGRCHPLREGGLDPVPPSAGSVTTGGAS